MAFALAVHFFLSKVVDKVSGTIVTILWADRIELDLSFDILCAIRCETGSLVVMTIIVAGRTIVICKYTPYCQAMSDDVLFSTPFTWLQLSQQPGYLFFYDLLL
jgi:hypothetical protein